LEPAINIALRAARKAGDLIVRASERMDLVKVEEKDVNDFVTNIDKASEEEVIYQLRKAWPDDTIVGEESGILRSNTPSDTTWYIDPLDGTTNFIRGIPHYAVSIGGVKNGRLEHAVVYDPVRREEFTASRGRGAALNGKRIRVSSQRQFNGALLGTGIPYRASQQPYLDGYMATVDHFARNNSGIRRAGSAALDLAYVAAGRLDAFWEYGLKPWDIAAGMLLVQEAGGLISDFKGGETSLNNGNIVCGNPKIFKPLLKIVNQNLGEAI
jgi:myo-inositol-1(or 4)-monophosphatase